MDQLKTMSAQVDGMTGIEGRLGLRLTGLESQSRETADRVDALEDRVVENEARFPDAIMRVIGPELDKMKAAPRREDDPRLLERYWLARQSLRLWPVGGPDLRGALRAFLLEKLGLQGTLVDSLGNVTIKTIDRTDRPGASARTQVKDEVLVIFPTPEARDAVRAGAAALGRSATPCGLRIEVSEHSSPTSRPWRPPPYKEPRVRLSLIHI